MQTIWLAWDATTQKGVEESMPKPKYSFRSTDNECEAVMASILTARSWKGKFRTIAGINPDFIGSVLERWRGATTNQKANLEDGATDPRPALEAEAAPLQPAPAPDPNRFRTLRRPLSEVYGAAQEQAPPGSPSRWSNR
jgi:hypothetical protein